MQYDELVFILYQIARESDDVLFEEQMVDLGWSVKKNGVQTENDNIEAGFQFKDLVHRLEVISDKAKNTRDKMRVEDLRNELEEIGVEDYVKKFRIY